MLTILSFGGGQDSTDILYRIIHDPGFAQKYVKGKLVVVMSDTGNEHESTYRHIVYIQALCAAHYIEFVFIRPHMGFHTRTWPSLQQWFKDHNSIMSVSFKKSCTDKLKIEPIYAWLDWYICSKIYYEPYPGKQISRKRYIKRFRSRLGTIRVLLGIAAGEDSRIARHAAKAGTWQACIEKVYPLHEEGINRQGCHDNARALNLPLPAPSNCKMCPFQSDIEILWQYRFDRTSFDEWVQLEQNKIERFKREGIEDKKNFGVKGLKLLPQVLERAQERYGHMSDEELHEYKMSHGHCVKSKY